MRRLGAMGKIVRLDGNEKNKNKMVRLEGIGNKIKWNNENKRDGGWE